MREHIDTPCPHQAHLAAAIGTLLLAALIALSAGCDTADIDRIEGCVDEHSATLDAPDGTPVQFCLKRAPLVGFWDTSRVYVLDSVHVVIEVEAVDSTAALNWWTTRVLVETDRGFAQEVLLRPIHCLEPWDSGHPYPLNYTWWKCGGVDMVVDTLSKSQISEIEKLVKGRLRHKRIMGPWNPDSLRGRGLYVFETPVGRPAIAAAVSLIRSLPYVNGIVERATHFPLCVLDDRIPPRPCPPWLLRTDIPVTYGTVDGKIPVRAGGWIRITYVQADGSLRRASIPVPPPRKN